MILLVPTTPASLLVQNMLSPESITEKPERPSPVSVLEPLFSEGDSSPENNTEKRGKGTDFQAITYLCKMSALISAQSFHLFEPDVII